jgi:3-deoxy-D-manno-octulosonate 8-phosphate phosphatase (KDO 8-P phosphatase)
MAESSVPDKEAGRKSGIEAGKEIGIEVRSRRIRLIVMDVDGVLSESRLIYAEGNGEVRIFNIKDGMGITLARLAGLEVALISGRESVIVARRAAELHITDVYQGVIRKLGTFFQILQKYDLDKEQACYIGDDINDLPIMREAGLAVAVADAVEDVKRAAHYVTHAPGGGGAVREIIDRILRFQNLYEDAIKIFV